MKSIDSLVTVVDIGIGNIGSVANMLKRVGATPLFVSDPAALSGATKVLLPGVGSFDAAVSKLDKLGFREALCEQAFLGTKICGICLGMQLLSNGSEEGSLPGLGLIPGRVRRFAFDPAQGALKIPHMGWNRIKVCKAHPLVKGLDDTSRFYFVHSYHYECTDEADVLLETTYGYGFASGIQRENVMGVQFHPEKSHRYGMQLMKNFVEL